MGLNCFGFPFRAPEEDAVYLSSLQTLQYYLVRLQGLAALLTQTTQYSVNTFLYPYVLLFFSEKVVLTSFWPAVEVSLFGAKH